jgi:hypothetical protein
MLTHVNAKSVPCAKCRKPSDCEVWGLRICYACHSAWIRDDRFSSGTINAALGISNEIEAFTEKNHARYCAEATKRTVAWTREAS